MVVLVRFGVIPEVARCAADAAATVQRGMQVVIESHRGQEIATVLEIQKPPVEPDQQPPMPSMKLLRTATNHDLSHVENLRSRGKTEFSIWEQRIRDWNLDLQLIDLEWTLDETKFILYVLNERGPECTKLALQVAAAGLGSVEVQPVDMDGIVSMPEATGGGCGSGGCGSGGCH